MPLTLRDYQQAAIGGLYQWLTDNDGNPLVVLPTGAGKSLVMAELVRDACTAWPGTRVLILAHVKELLEQNSRELQKHWPNVDLGVYSAGMRSRDLHNQVIVASIQSIYKKAFDLGRVDVVLVDEAHLIPRDSDTMYRKFLTNIKIANPNSRVVGLTATDYRLDSGRLTEGEDRFFHGVAHETPIRSLIDRGFLCWLTSRRTTQQLDVAGVKTRGGEFIPGELERAVDKDSITRAAVGEIVDAGHDRRAWLVFCSGVEHAHHVASEIVARGYPAAVVSGETPTLERERIIRDFKDGRLRALCNMNVLTTGFNVPAVDLIAMLRPTNSTGLYVQMVGRGSRTSPGKTDCLVLDFAANIERHGPVDALAPKGKGKGKDGEAPVKPCPKCSTYCLIAARVCPQCEFEFPEPESKLKPKADQKREILSNTIPPEWLRVSSVKYFYHEKAGGTPSLRVEYNIGFYQTVKEWVCLEHGGFAGEKASVWWYRMKGKLPAPKTIEAALKRLDELIEPGEIQVRKEGKYDRVCGYRFSVDSRPVAGDERDFESEGGGGEAGGEEVEPLQRHEAEMGGGGQGVSAAGGDDIPF